MMPIFWMLSLMVLSVDGSSKEKTAKFPGFSAVFEGINLRKHEENLGYTLMNIHYHNTTSFTEGFLFDGDTLVESTGLAGKSFIREISIRNNHIKQQFQLPPSYFGEGIAVLGKYLYVLTYKSQKGFVLKRDNFSLVDSFTFETHTKEGWGMTTDGESLIVSDGSSFIYYWKPSKSNSMKLFRKLNVVDQKGNQLKNINELEYVDGFILANVWFTDFVYIINCQSGKVQQKIDLSKLKNRVLNLDHLKGFDKTNAVMNGIAYNSKNRRFYVTGKLWDCIFELQLKFFQKRYRISKSIG